MIKIKTLILLIFFSFIMFPVGAEKKDPMSFLRTQGQDIVDGRGNKILLKGVGLGNWLLPEGYMWKFGKNGDRPRKIEKIVSDLIGKVKAEQFWLAFRRNYITEADIERIAELGFNSVRPALNARRFMTEGRDAEFIDEGFNLLDSLVSWCRKHRLYVIIDMHGAPGGQTGQNIDDSPNNLPELFMDERNQDRLVDLWVKIADRYKDEPTVAAYDLLNEPLPAYNGSAAKYKHLVEPLYMRLTKAIREVDKKHMITLEGVDWSNDWSIFSEPFDDNLFYQFHYYCWDRPDLLKSVESFISRREDLGTPVWVGETGEKHNTIYWGTTQYFEHHNIGWSFWPWKKMDTKNTPYSIEKPAGWDAISDYSRGGDMPDPEVAEKAFNALLHNLKLENCVYFPDVVNSIFRRIPGKVEAENFAHKGFGKSYFVKDTSQSAKFYRLSEFVPIDVFEAHKEAHVSEQYIVLSNDEWIEYEMNCLNKSRFQMVMRIKQENGPVKIRVSLNNKESMITIEDSDWTDKNIGLFNFEKGLNSIRISILNGRISMDYFEITKAD